MQCPTCGSRVPDGADVCPDCGMDLQNLSASAPAPAPAPASASEPTSNSAPAAKFAPPDSNGDSDAFDAFDFDDFSEASNTPPTPISLDKTSVDSNVDPRPEVQPEMRPAAQIQRATLTLKRGGSLTEEKFVIGALASIGRFDPESGPVDVDMANLPEASYVSRHHAEIHCSENVWQIKDLGSRNGTFVRAASGGAFARVQGEHALHDGDEISLGNARFEFRCEH